MELELSHLIEALPGLVWTAHPDGRAEFLNRRWCEYTGLSVEQTSGLGWQSALHPEDVDLVIQYWGSLLKTQRPGKSKRACADTMESIAAFYSAPHRCLTGRAN